jgi:hypothetical protein
MKARVYSFDKPSQLCINVLQSEGISTNGRLVLSAVKCSQDQ